MTNHSGDIFGSSWEADELFKEKTVISSSTHACTPCQDHNTKHPYTYLHKTPTPGHPMVDIPPYVRDRSERNKHQTLAHGSKNSSRQTTNATQDKHYRIAIVVPNRTYGIDQKVLGFVKKFAKEQWNVVHFIYNAEGNSTFLYHHIVPELTKHNYDLICTVGNECTSLVARFLSHQPLQIPQIFVGVSDPAQLELDSARDYVTGIRANNNLTLYINAILATKPTTKKAGIIFNPSECGGMTTRAHQRALQLFQDHNVEVKSVTISRTEEIRHAAETLAQEVDILVTLPDNMIKRAIGVLIDVCNATNKLLCVPDLSAVQQGAGFGFGCAEYSVGSAAAVKAIAILRDHLSVDDISIGNVTEKYYFLVNPHTRYAQGLHLSLPHMITLEHGRMLQ